MLATQALLLASSLIGPGALASSTAHAQTSDSQTATEPDETQAPPTKQQCARSYETAQELRVAQSLTRTREELLICSQSLCPSFVQSDCLRWLAEVERELPSFVIETVGPDGAPVTDAVVELDGKRLTSSELGQPIAVDPGNHQLLIRTADGVESTRALLAHAGLQDRRISIPVGAVSDANGVLEDAAEPSRNSMLPYAYASIGASALGLGAFAVLGHMGRTDEKALRDECSGPDPSRPAGSCLPEDNNRRISDYRALQTYADVGLIVGLVGAAAGLTMLVLEPDTASEPNEQSYRWAVAPTAHGAFATLLGHF